MMVPTVHLNGTSREQLLRQQLGVLDAFRVLDKAMAESSPNGRDYYPQGNDALAKAQAEHRDRWQRLAAVKSEIEALAMAIGA